MRGEIADDICRCESSGQMAKGSVSDDGLMRGIDCGSRVDFHCLDMSQDRHVELSLGNLVLELAAMRSAKLVSWLMTC